MPLGKKSFLFGELDSPFCCSINPDCLNCMRTKLKASCIVVFVKTEEGWQLGSFQGEIPEDAAEALFYGMLRSSVPQVLANYPSGLLLKTDREIDEFCPQLHILFGKSVLAATVMLGEFKGIRLAWRDQSESFSFDELAEIQCTGNCPPGCRPC